MKVSPSCVLGPRRCLGVVLAMAAVAARAEDANIPDRSHPDYVYCEDFEEGKARDGSLPAFSIRGRHGVRAGAGCRSRYGYSNIILENNSLPPYPTVRFPRQTGVTFVHYDLMAPANFYLGRANHGYYLYDSANRKAGSVVMDHATDHPAWLDPEWDPHTINVLRGSGYHRMTRSFEGFEPKPRGQWHSHQVMIVPSPKDPNVGRIKVWIDGELANECKHDTIPSFDTFWISNYWHSLEYVPKDTLSNLFEAHTAPPHPAFEVFLDNLIISKSFIEFGPNRFQVERIRFAQLSPDAFTVHFDTTAAAKTVGASWGPVGGQSQEMQAAAVPTGYFHALRIAGLVPGTTYQLRLRAVDAKGRAVESTPIRFLARAGATPDFELPGWKGEVYGNQDFEGPPAYVRSFASLSYIAWPGPDSDELVDTSRPMSVRYTKKLRVAEGKYTFRVRAYDGVRVLVDGRVKVDRVKRTQGHKTVDDFAIDLTEGEHTVVVEHVLWRADDWERTVAKYLAFKIDADDRTPPKLLSGGVYSSKFHKPTEAAYVGRWDEECAVTIDYGTTPDYGQTAGSPRQFTRLPRIVLSGLEPGKTYFYRVTAVDPSGNTTVLGDARFVAAATVPPRKTLVSLERASPTALRLMFTAPGEEAKHGTAARYDVRWSAQRLTASNWDRATPVEGLPAPSPAGTRESLVLDGFPAGKTYYVAVCAINSAGLAGLLSNVVSDPPGPEEMDCDGDGFGVGCAAGPDPDDYDAAVPAATRPER